MVNEATGIKINEEAQVINVGGDVIPRLYALGRVTGGQYGQLYTCGTALSTGLIMGRIAGKNAAAFRGAGHRRSAGCGAEPY